MERDRAEQGREAGKLMMLRVERGGRAVCNREGEREREGAREGVAKKKKTAEEGETRRTREAACRCWRLGGRSAALSGHRKMVSVRGELTVAYNLMFSILDSFSMGNATARNSRGTACFFSSSLIYSLD